MLIVMYVPGIPFDGETATQQALGGSETAGWSMAREFAKRGHEVKVFTEGQREIIVDGVLYTGIGERSQMAPMGDRFTPFATKCPADVLIIQRVPGGFMPHYNSKLNYLWLHDMPAGRHAQIIGSTLWQLDGVLCLSDFHRQAVKDVYSLPDEAIRVTSNGLDMAHFAGLGEGGIADRQKGHLLYSSRPERGLEHLVRPGGIMDKLREARPGQFVLHLCAYEDPPQAGNPQLQAFYAQLWQWSQRPDVIFEGNLPKRQLYELMSRCWAHCYPTEFPEVSCITAMETQGAGLPIITSSFAALKETLARAGAVLIPHNGETADEDVFVAKLVNLYDDDVEWERLHRKALDRRNSYTWTSVAAEWEGMFEARLAARSGNVDAMARQYINNEDITALRDLAGRNALPDHATSALKHFDWSSSIETYRAAYDRHYEHDFADETIRPHFILMPHGHFSIRQKLVADALSTLQEGARILDLGCAEGTLTLNLAMQLPQYQFQSVDLNEKNLAVIRSAQADHGVANLECYQGDEYALPDTVKGAQAVLLGEILEHFIDPIDSLNRILVHVGGNPLVVLTTPYGPWGVAGNIEIERRMHLHHYERQDILEMFGHMDGFQIVGIPAHETEYGEKCGNHVFSFRASAAPKAIDFKRKHRQQAPPQTLALCMIAYDAAGSIGRAIKSAKPLTSEIFVAVDNRTTDMTREIARWYGATVFDIPSPLEIGFAEARNLSIAQAKAEWILWLDHDEWLVWPERLKKYLRMSPITAFGVPQHHFACEPLGVMKTDFPARLFRNGLGIKWFGDVHEHPELGLNKGIGQVIIAGDIAIHHAYDTEHERKKRFARNRPLMKRDAESNPDRKLRWYLELRDLSYELEEMSRAGRFDAAFKEHVENAEVYWEKIVNEGISRIIYDAVEHWSRVNQARNVGIWFRCSLEGVNFTPISAGPPAQPMPLEGRFVDRAEIERVLSILLKDQVDPMLKRTF